MIQAPMHEDNFLCNSFFFSIGGDGSIDKVQTLASKCFFFFFLIFHVLCKQKITSDQLNDLN